MLQGQFDFVTIKSNQVGRHINVTSVSQASDILTSIWPAKGIEKAYFAAVRACMDQLRGDANAEAVRKTFAAAAKEAGVFVCERRKSRRPNG